jgi:hypothetical protein
MIGEYWLFRVHPNQTIETMDELLPFGRQAAIVSHLCDAPGFTFDAWHIVSSDTWHIVTRDLKVYIHSEGVSNKKLIKPTNNSDSSTRSNSISWESYGKRSSQETSIVTITYEYAHKHDKGRIINYSLTDDPIIGISLEKCHAEDFLPLIDVLKDLSPFDLKCLASDTINLDSLSYSLDAWLQINYEENDFIDYEL